MMHSVYLWSLLALVLVVNYSSHANLLRPRFPVSSRFLLYRTNVIINDKACTCSTIFSCSCCETVTIFYTQVQKKLCSNFMYQRNGLNVDISLGTDTIKTSTITNYRPLKLCAAIPGSLFSSLCVNILQLDQYSRSITVCVRHEIRSKVQQWQINYSCLGISTLLPVVVSPVSSSAIVAMTTGAMTTTPAATTIKSPPPMIATLMANKPNRVKIVNNRTPRVISKVQRIAESEAADNSTFSRIIIDLPTLYDRSQNFPSRIPPVLQGTVNMETGVADPKNTGAITFSITDDNRLKNQTNPLIFPD